MQSKARYDNLDESIFAKRYVHIKSTIYTECLCFTSCRSRRRRRRRKKNKNNIKLFFINDEIFCMFLRRET